MVMIDSSVWIDFFNEGQSWQAEKLYKIVSEERIYIGDLILAEVLQGFRKDRDYETAKVYLGMFQCVNLLNKEMAIKCAENYRTLRKRGITIRKTADIIIATFCIENKFTLLHSDKDFDQIEKHLGLMVIKKN
ncbi:MAG: type II toxin-antitoxin system VapC family toxin [Ignavibacteriaceae bacterium]